MSSKVDRWESFLNPEIVRGRLLSASMYITAHELLRDSIVGRVRDFYAESWEASGSHPSPSYEQEVLARNRSAVYASLDWLREHKAIDEEDVKLFEAVKKTRNVLVHGLHSVVIGGDPSNHVDHFADVVSLLRKIETWWIVNVEIPSNPDYDGQEIDEAGIVPGPVLSLQMLIEVASGRTTLLNHYRNAPKPRQDA